MQASAARRRPLVSAGRVAVVHAGRKAAVCVCVRACLRGVAGGEKGARSLETERRERVGRAAGRTAGAVGGVGQLCCASGAAIGWLRDQRRPDRRFPWGPRHEAGAAVRGGRPVRWTWTGHPAGSREQTACRCSPSMTTAHIVRGPIWQWLANECGNLSLRPAWIREQASA